MVENSGGGMYNKDQYDYLFKFIIIGDAGAGKSCLLHQFIEGKFKKSSSHTIGVEFGSKIIQVRIMLAKQW
jgi:Ras-related protein Rab-4B